MPCSANQNQQQIAAQIQQLYQQQLLLQQQQSLVSSDSKKGRKRKNTSDSLPPHSAPSTKSPKRKTSFEEDSDPFSLLRHPSSIAGQSTVNQLLAGNMNLMADPSVMQSMLMSGQQQLHPDFLEKYQKLQRIMSMPSSMDSSEASSSSQVKGRKRSRVRSTESQDSLTGEGMSLLSDSSADPFSQLLLHRPNSLPNSTTSKTGRPSSASSSQVGRRCSSAGFQSNARTESASSSFDFVDDSIEEPASDAKKKRKRSESVDSITKSSSILMMPPPSSTGDQSSSSLERRMTSPVSVGSSDAVKSVIKKTAATGVSSSTLPKASAKTSNTPSPSKTSPKVKTGLKIKSQVSSSGYNSNTLESPPVSSSSSSLNPQPLGLVSDTDSSSPSVSSSKKLQTLPGLQPCPFTQQSKKAAGKLGSLSAVIDKLSNKTGVPSNEPTASSDSSSIGVTSSSVTTGQVKKRPGSATSSDQSSSSNPTASSANTTFKATLSGNKLTIRKKPTSSSSTTTSVVSSGSTGNKTPSSSLISRPKVTPSGVKPGILKKVTPGSRVSSSSSNPQAKAATKVSSSQVSSGSAILEEALGPRLRLDQLPRIPKAERTQSNPVVTQQQPSSSSQPSNDRPEFNPLLIRRKSAQQQPQQMLPPLLPLERPFFPAEQGLQSPPTEGPTQTKFQSNTISSSEVMSSGFSREAATYMPTPTSQVSDSTAGYSQSSSNAATTSSSFLAEDAPPDVSSASIVKQSVISSSDEAGPESPSSTPSSPVEASAVKAVPLIIPTEAAFDSIDSSGLNDNMISEDEDDDGLVIDVDYSAVASPSKSASSTVRKPTTEPATESKEVIDSSCEVSPSKTRKNSDDSPVVDSQVSSIASPTTAVAASSTSSPSVAATSGFSYPSSSLTSFEATNASSSLEKSVSPSRDESPSTSSRLKKEDTEVESSSDIKGLVPYDDDEEDDDMEDALMDEALLPSSEPQL